MTLGEDNELMTFAIIVWLNGGGENMIENEFY